MKRKLILIIIGIIVSALVISVIIKPIKSQEIKITKWEYRVEYFSRDDFMVITRIQTEKKIKQLGLDGWEYAGPLCNDGINAQFILFKRPIIEK
jgi:hypothetical protein